ASSVIDALRALGVRVALDDLSNGSSSRSPLRDLRSDRLKIDRSVIGDPKPFGRAIAAAIAALGRSLGTDVVAEGVETPEQLAFCRAAGVPKLQGWLLHRPSKEWPPLRVALPGQAAGDAPPI
ncbi:MAG: EAL domain-containing protein, partial [Anaerolineae bacterium]|nr:EAL domain-containing protein [Anaerolineae bacterium]